MRRLTCCAFVALALACSGCAAIGVVGQGQAADAQYREDQLFARWFSTTNTERRKIGLDTLDYCSEYYLYSHTRAAVLKPCRDRVKRYEHGDSTALWWPK